MQTTFSGLSTAGQTNSNTKSLQQTLSSSAKRSGQSLLTPVLLGLLSRAVGAVVRMHVTIVGDGRWKFCAERDWQDAFVAEGHDAILLDEKTISSEEIYRAAKKTDLLLWISSNTVHGKNLMRKCNEVTTTAGWHPDLFWGLTRPRWKNAPIWVAQHVFTSDGGKDELWAGMGVDHNWLLPGVRQIWTERPSRVRDGFLCDVAFVGNDGSTYHKQWPYRKELLTQLGQICSRNGWTFKNPGGSHRKVERNQNMNDFYKSASVTVGDSLCLDFEKAKYWSDRVYEASGRSGLIIMPQINALSAQTGSWLPTYPWGDWGALEAQIGAYLTDSSANSRARKEGNLWAQGQTYRHRVREMLEVVT